MNIKKSTLSLAVITAFSSGTAQAFHTELSMTFTGLFTIVNQGSFTPLQNGSSPYAYDATWGYGLRTQISGILQYDTRSGYGTASINPFEFINGGPAVIPDFQLQRIDNNLVLGNMLFSWNNTESRAQIVLDGSGLFSELDAGLDAGVHVFDTSTCVTSGACSTPASNDYQKNQIHIGPSPIATTSFNTIGQDGFDTVVYDLSLGTDDGFAGSPLDNGPFEGYNINIDFTSVEVTAFPIPASIWLFGSGLISLLGLARRKHSSQ